MNTQWIGRIATLLSSAAVAAWLASAASAQGFPQKPVRYLVPFGPGGGNDVVARIVAQKLTENWTQPVVVDNRPGASGGIAMEMAANAPADGYTIVLPSTSVLINQLVSKVRYDMTRDFAPVSLSGSLPYVIAVTSSLPATSVNELIALAKARPGKINYAATPGSLQHLLGETLKVEKGIDIMMIPYKSSTFATTDVIAGLVEIWFTQMSTGLPQARAGKVRILGFSGEKRSPMLPDVPTMAEAGVPTLNATASFYILAPAGTSKTIVDALNAQIVRAFASDDVRARLFAAGFEPKSSTPDELGAILRSELARWGKIVKQAGIRLTPS
jgi:tripartite-type tricarboxylate transporter receptor subunit TctC